MVDGVAAWARGSAGERLLEVELPEQEGRRLALRELDALALAGEASVLEGGEHGQGGELSGHVVGMLERGAGGVGGIGMVPEERRAGEGGGERPVGGRLAERAAAPVTLRGDVDHVGTERPDRLVVEPEAPEETALTVLGDHVRRGAEPAREIPALGGVEVEADASLTAILVVEHRRAVRTAGLGRQPAKKVRARLRLDLDHLGAEIA